MSSDTEDTADRTLSSSFADFEMVDPEEGRETPTDALDGGDPEPSAPVEVSSQALPGTPVDPGTATTGSRSEPISTQPRANASVSDAEGAGPAAPTSSSSLSRTLQALAYYENPVRSGLVFGKLVGLYVLLACDLGVTLLFIGAQAVFFTTAGVLMLANVKFLIDRHYNGITNPILFPQQLLEPVMATAAELAEPLLVSEETAVAAVRAVYAALPRARAEVLSVLYCTSFKKTSQVLVFSYLAGQVAWWFSIATLALVGTLSFFTLPLAYRKYQSDVDQALDALRGQLQQATASLPPWVTDFFVRDDAEGKAKAH